MLQKELNKLLLSEDNPKQRFYLTAAIKGIKHAKNKLRQQITDLKIELSGIPESGLFGEKLREEKLNKIKELEELL